jgi:predicted MFS family arabinose efflux permease
VSIKGATRLLYHEKAKTRSRYGNIVFALGAALGGPLGGIFGDTLGWKWAFLIQGKASSFRQEAF